MGWVCSKRGAMGNARNILVLYIEGKEPLKGRGHRWDVMLQRNR
jgi:hypothetical protein